jgi:hypothetical protein
MNLLDRFFKIKQAMLECRALWRNNKAQKRWRALQDLLVADKLEHKDPSFYNLFSDVSTQLGYTPKSPFSAISSSAEDFNSVFDLAESKLKQGLIQ